MITVYTPNFERVGTITDNESSVISNSFYSKGDFEIYIDKNKKYTEHLVEGNIVQFGNSKTDTGIITHRSLSRDDLGKTDNRLFIKGFTLEQLIYNRVIVPPIGKNYMSFEGNQEYIMKQFVYHNLINSEDKNRNIPLILSEDKGLGKSDRWRGRYENLGEFLNKIGNYSNLGWEVSLDVKNKCFIFDVKKGVNRQNNNKVRPPIIFEVSFGNIFSREFIEDSTNSKNVLYGGGSGANENKIFQKVGDFKGLHRIEGYQEFTGVDSPIDLRKELENAAKELQPTKTFNVEVAPDKPFTFGKDYFLGDYVTVLDKELGVKLNTQITRVTKYDQGLSGIDITFGKDVLSFSSSTSSGSTGLIDIPSTSDIPEPTPGKPGKDGKDGKDGISLEYNWDNTKLGIKREDELYFSYVDLKGEKGDKGRDGVDGRHGLDGKDGIGLDYSWSGTRLGIKKENESSYSYVNLKGDKGDKGDKGEPGSDSKITKDNIESALGFTPANKTDIPEEKVFLNDNVTESNGPDSFSEGVTISNNGSNKFPTIGEWGMAITFKPSGLRATQLYITKDGELWGRRGSTANSWASWYSVKNEIDKKADKAEVVTSVNGKKGDVTVEVSAPNPNKITNGNFEKNLDGWEANQSSRLSTNNNILKCIFNQTTSTPGIRRKEHIFLKGMKHTVSALIKNSNPSNRITFYLFKKSGGSVSSQNFIVDNTWTRIQATLDLDNDDEYKLMILTNSPSDSNDFIEVTEVKIEEGSKFTGWSKHENDIKSNTKITTSKSVSSSSWSKSGDYYRARISDSSVTSRSIVDVNIHLSDLEKASDLLPVTQSYSGYFYLYANSKPSSTIWFDYKVVKE